jgi:MSHA biogenesis protein MshP
MHRSHPRRCRGFSAIAAIAILVILAALGAFVVTVSGVQHVSSALDVQGSRAFQAARAGIEWGAYQLLTASPETCVASTPITGLAGDMGDFTVTVQCSSSPQYTEFGNTVRVYTLTSTACNIGPCPNTSTTEPTYVERQLTGVIATCHQGSAMTDPAC